MKQWIAYDNLDIKPMWAMELCKNWYTTLKQRKESVGFQGLLTYMISKQWIKVLHKIVGKFDVLTRFILLMF